MHHTADPETKDQVEATVHDSHIASQGSLCRVHETVYWPGMNGEITDYIQKCDVCMSLQSNQTKEPLICHEPTSRPWEKVAWHLQTWWRELSWHSRLLLWILRSGSVTQQNRNCHHKETWRHVVTHGTPNELLSGNELPFNYPQSNGWLENAVKTAKSLSKKAKASGANCFLSLLSWRNTPTEGLGTLLSVCLGNVRKEEIKELADVRSYKVKNEHGRILRRNRRHRCRSREPFYSSRPSEAPVALQPPDMAASPEKLQGPQPTEGQSFPTGPVQGDQSKQLTKTLLQYLARPNLCEQHLTSLGQLKIGSQELVGCQSHLAI